MRRIAVLLMLMILGCGALGADSGKGAGLFQSTWVVHRDIEYAKVGKKSLKLDIYTSSAKTTGGKLPLLVWIHGGAWRAGSRKFCPMTDLIVQGYIVASIDYRLSQEAVFPAQIYDCKAAIRFLRANADKYGIDADHIGVCGGSAGGHLVALLGTSGDVKELEGDVGGNLNVSSRVQAVVDFFGPTDVSQIKNKDGSNKDDPKSPLFQLFGGKLADKADLVKQANPITFINKDNPPFFIAHGSADDTVPINQSQLLVDALKAAGVEVTYEVVKGAGHGFSQRQHQNMLPRLTEFLDKHLKLPAATQPAQ